jgi:hypothetical protein
MKVCDLCREETDELHYLNPSYQSYSEGKKLHEICGSCLNEINDYISVINTFFHDKKESYIKRFVKKLIKLAPKEG